MTLTDGQMVAKDYLQNILSNGTRNAFLNKVIEEKKEKNHKED